MTLKTVDLNPDLNDFLSPTNPNEFFAPYKLHSQSVMVYSIIHALAQRTFKAGDDAVFNIDVYKLSELVNISLGAVKLAIMDLNRFNFIDSKYLEANIFEITINNLDIWETET